jgi:hypothetical protein
VSVTLRFFKIFESRRKLRLKESSGRKYSILDDHIAVIYYCNDRSMGLYGQNCRQFGAH